VRAIFKIINYFKNTSAAQDAEIDKAWAEESERRLDAYLKDETTARDAKDVLAKYLKR